MLFSRMGDAPGHTGQSCHNASFICHERGFCRGNYSTGFFFRLKDCRIGEIWGNFRLFPVYSCKFFLNMIRYNSHTNKLTFLCSLNVGSLSHTCMWGWICVATKTELYVFGAQLRLRTFYNRQHGDVWTRSLGTALEDGYGQVNNCTSTQMEAQLK